MLYKIYSRIVYFISQYIFWFFFTFFFGFSVEGRENIPKKENFIVACNHVSYLDPAVIGASFRRQLYFMAGDHLYESSIQMALWLESVDCIRIRRDEPDHRAMRKLLRYLKDQRSIAIFPEGTRSVDGSIKEAHAGIGFLALRSGVPVIPCFISGTREALPKGAKALKPSKISVHIGKPLAAKTFRYEGPRREAYRLFSKKVMEKIAELRR